MFKKKPTVDFSDQMEAAYALLDQGRIAEAEQAFRACISGGHLLGWLGVGEILLAQDQSRPAATYSEAATGTFEAVVGKQSDAADPDMVEVAVIVCQSSLPLALLALTRTIAEWSEESSPAFADLDSRTQAWISWVDKLVGTVKPHLPEVNQAFGPEPVVNFYKLLVGVAMNTTPGRHVVNYDPEVALDRDWPLWLEAQRGLMHYGDQTLRSEVQQRVSAMVQLWEQARSTDWLANPDLQFILGRQ